MRMWGTRGAWGLGAALVSVAAGAGFREVSFGDVGGWRALHSWCDTPGRVLAVTTPAQPHAVTPQPVTLAQWTGGRLQQQAFQLGPQDAGAGQLYTTLTVAGREVSMTPQFFIHSSNIENVADPAYRLTHINEYRVPQGSYRCRYVPGAEVLAATAKHSVVVWHAGNKLTYSSRNRDGTPGVTLTGGTYQRVGGSSTYTWTRGAYRYVLQVGNAEQPGGRLTVLRQGQVVSRQSLLAYSLSLPK